MLKIVHLQTLVSFQGNAPMRLHQAMLDEGCQSKILIYNSPRANSSTLYRFSGVMKLFKAQAYAYLQKAVAFRKKKNTYFFSYPKVVGNNVANHPFVQQADVIYLHWIVGGFLNLKNIEALLKLGKPVVFFMHDMWTVTGGCHHSFDCEGYKTNCEYCPLFEGDKKYSWASTLFKEKKKLFSKYENAYFMSPSKWLMSCAEQSGLLVHKSVSNIPNIVDENVFKKIDSAVAKSILNIDKDSITVTFGCVAGKNNAYKGWEYLEKALKSIYATRKDLKLNIVVYGSDYDQATADAIPFPIRFLGQINDETTMMVLNNATDVFVSPTLAENFSQTLLENVMCQTPVVGFNVGGVPEIIEHKKNGYLAEYKSAEDLANGILFCIDTKIEFDPPKQYFKKVLLNSHLQFMQSKIDTKA